MRRFVFAVFTLILIPNAIIPLYFISVSNIVKSFTIYRIALGESFKVLQYSLMKSDWPVYYCIGYSKRKSHCATECLQLMTLFTKYVYSVPFKYISFLFPLEKPELTDYSRILSLTAVVYMSTI